MQSEEDFRILADTLPQIVWIAGTDGNVRYLNAQWYAYTGMTPEASQGRGWLEAIHPEDLRKSQEVSHNSNPDSYSKTFSLNSSAYELNLRIRRSDGNFRWFLARGISVRDSEGNLLRRIGTSTDIHDQTKLQQEMRKAREAADAASMAKSAFLANMSHEIRTPIGVILGFSELLKRPNLSERERRDFVNAISRNGQALSYLVDDILDLAKVEAEKLQIENRRFELRPLLRDVVSSLSVNAGQKGISLIYNCAEDVPSTIESDPIRLRQVLLNIIGNGIKFTDEGYVRLSVSCDDNTDSDKQLIVFTICDTGCGIPTKDIEQLFQPFSQVDSSTTKRNSGTGLGLMISRKLARILGGDVLLLSTIPGEGSIFEIKINAGLTLSDRQGAQTLPFPSVFSPPVVQGTLLDGLKLLLAEDAPDNQFLIRSFLEAEGATVVVAENGALAVTAVKLQDFDMILMDIQMPVMDGYQATRQLRANGFMRPILALTAYAMPEDRVRCLEAGCDERLTKPIRFDRLIEMILSLSGKDQSKKVILSLPDQALPLTSPDDFPG